MNKIYPRGSIGYKIQAHNNNYGFNVLEKIERNIKKLPSISIVIPYYESRKTINEVLRKLFAAIQFAKNIDQTWKYEVILIDDGSLKFPFLTVSDKTFLNKVKIIKHSKNLGITQSRNDGLGKTNFPLIIFMDSDILIPQDMIYKHLLLHKHSINIITFSLFHFIDYEDWENKPFQDDLYKIQNDWRIDCKYQKNWIGCQNDKQFIDRHYRIMDETDYLRKWPKSGSLGPWIITNMVNGGLFCVNRKKSLTVSGFSSIFGKYGFIETSLVTKLVAEYDSYIIPIPFPFAVDIYNKEAAYDKHKRDQLFRKAHKIYFEKFLTLSREKIKHEKI